MEYRIIRSGRRTAALELTRQMELVVRVPQGMPDAAVRRFVEEHREWIGKAAEKQRARLERHPEPTAEEAAALRALAWKVLPAKAAYYAGQMGVTPSALHITSARTRFGSCSGKNSISFSWRLMQYPEAAIDYVVVHELAHIRHHNHSAAFYSFVEKILPDYRERARLLR